MADPDKLTVFNAHLATLRNESSEALMERYGFTPSDLTTAEKVIRAPFTAVDPGWILGKMPNLPSAVKARKHESLHGMTTQRKAESLRQGDPRAVGEIIENMKKREQAGPSWMRDAALEQDVAIPIPWETAPFDLDSDDGEYFSERVGGPQEVSDTYRQQAGDRVTRAARELGVAGGIFTAPKGTLEQLNKWEDAAINDLRSQAAN
jgi:hypothetical protein